MAKTNIEWCDITLNPIVGCSHCSPGCDRCYAETFAQRLSMNPNPKIAAKYAGVIDEMGWTGRISKLDISCFDKLPKKPSRIFVGSMTDFFHENANFDDQGEVLAKIAHIPQHTFLFLTKRPERAYRRYHTKLPNVWIGVTVCNQQEAEEKLPILMQIPAAKRFVSVEPMLEPVDLDYCVFDRRKEIRHLVYGPACLNEEQADYMVNPVIDWVICGAETGPGARPMNLQWARDLRDQCQAARVPFFFKKAGNKKEIPEDLMIREFPE